MHSMLQTISNQALHTSHFAIQTKLKVSHPDDVYEQEAERVAEQVTRISPESFPIVNDEKVMHKCKNCGDEEKIKGKESFLPELLPTQERLQRKCTCATSVGMTGECEECREKREVLQLRSMNQNEAVEMPLIVNEVLRSQGEPLDPTTRSFMESRFGYDLSQVRVHTDAKAAESARAVNSLAYTVGHDIVFRAGQYVLGTVAGRRLLGHELAHVIQQSRGGPTPELDPEAAHERSAEIVASEIMAGHANVDITGATGVGIARDNDKPMSAAHAGGEMGERDVAFILGKSGLEIVTGPGGPTGHKLTKCGFDCLAFKPETGEVWIIDNKASSRVGKIRDASAITKNLEINLVGTIEEVKALQDFPKKTVVLEKLNATLSATRSGTKIPNGVRLVVTNAGGYATGVGKDLAAKGIEFVDAIGPEIITAWKADIKAAKAVGVKPGRPVTPPTTEAEAISSKTVTPKAEAKSGTTSVGTPPESERVLIGTKGAVETQQLRAQRVESAALAISAALDFISNRLADWQIRRNMEERLKKNNKFIEETLVTGIGIFVVVRVEQWKIPDENGNRVRVFNTLYLIPAKSYEDGIDKWRVYPILESWRGEGWETVSYFAFIPPR